MYITPSSGGRDFESLGTFVLDEDEALKNWLKGMTVGDDKNPSRPVDVWFAMPDMEVREQRFPFIVLELVGINEGKDRELAGLHYALNDPGDTTPYADHGKRSTQYGLPMDLIYQATVYARHPRHHRQIISQMLRDKVPGRRLALPIPSIGAKVYMELLSWASRDTIESGRKLWQTVYTIKVCSSISDINTGPTPPVRIVNVETDQNIVPAQDQ